MEFISERVSIEQGERRLSVVISARPSTRKQVLLITWVLAWIVCGALILIERGRVPVGDPLRQYLLAFLAFWLYFMVQTGRAALWRLKGYEVWRVKDGRLSIKDSTFGLGRATEYFGENIKGLGLLKVDRTAWKWQWNESLWVIGGERLGFEHMGRKVVFGKNLSDEEARGLVPLLKHALKSERKG